MTQTFTVLGIESSCDDTAVAIVRGRPNEPVTILAEAAHSQIDLHQVYGGVVPEIAARSHLDKIQPLLEYALKKSGLKSFREVDAIAATSGPGLIGGVIVGLLAGKGLAAALGKPLIGVNHLEGHALTVRATDAVSFPYLLLLVSGGHCQILIVKGVGDYVRLGTTLDDAVGEAFDKVAKLLGLGYPGGPLVEKRALRGNPDRFPLPRPLSGTPDPNFSFSGLKTAVLRAYEGLERVTETDLDDLCASFQAAVTACLYDRCRVALKQARRHLRLASDVVLPFVVAGGVAANQAIRTVLAELAEQQGAVLVAPPVRLCTDNGVMIAWAGLERLAKGDIDPLDLAPRARWPLDPEASLATGIGGTKS